MYLRTTARRNNDGSMVRYVALAHNQRVGGGDAGASVLLEPGPGGPARRGRAAPAGRARSTATSANPTRHATRPPRRAPTPRRRADGGRVPPGRGGVAARRAVAGAGRGRRAAQGRWARAGSPPTWSGCCSRWWPTGRSTRRASWPPRSGPSRRRDPGPGRRWTRTRPTGRWTCWSRPTPTAEVQEAVFFAVANLLNLEVDLLFFDTTCTYFERDTEDDAARTAVPPVTGTPRTTAGDLPQIVIGLAVTREGIPVRVWCWPGNTNDQAVLPQVQDDLRDWRLGRVVTVVDRGFSSAENLAYLRRGRRALHRRRTDARRQPARRAGAVPAGPLPAGPRQPAGQGSPLDATPGCGGSSATTPRRPNATTPQREDGDRPDRRRAGPDREGPRPATDQQAHRTARPPPQRGRARARRVRAARPPRPRPLAAPDRPGRLVIDRAKINAEARLDGKYLIVHLRPAPIAPRTSRWATRTCSKPNAASAT